MGKQVYIVFMYLHGVPYMEVFEHDIHAEIYRSDLQKAVEKGGFSASPVLISLLVRDSELDISGQHFHMEKDTDGCSPILTGKE